MTATLANRLLIDALDRVRDDAHAVLDGLAEEALTYRPDPAANSITWLLWHANRVLDDHLCGIAALLHRPGAEQVWTSDGWCERFALPFVPEEIGYGQSAAEAGQVRVPSDLLAGYCDAVHTRAVAVVGQLDDADYSEIVDDSYDPPVTVAARLVSLVNDATQHGGQAAYLRGVWERSAH